MLFARLRRPALLGVAATAVSVLAPLTVATAPATAAPAEPAATVVTAQSAADAVAPAARAQRVRARQIARGKRIVRVAARYKGRPYRWGASGPRAFDCSGYTAFVVRRAIGTSLPHSSAMQSRSGKVDRIKRAHRRPGDLVFFPGRGRVHHVAIYAGGGKIWHAPRPGKRVQKVRLYTRNVFYGRVV